MNQALGTYRGMCFTSHAQKRILGARIQRQGCSGSQILIYKCHTDIFMEEVWSYRNGWKGWSNRDWTESFLKCWEVWATFIKCFYSLVFLAKAREYPEANLRCFWPAHTTIYHRSDETSPEEIYHPDFDNIQNVYPNWISSADKTAVHQ